MRPLLVFLFLLFFVTAASSHECCPHVQAFKDKGWVIHKAQDFTDILTAKLQECLPEFGHDLILDAEESYVSDFCHDQKLLLWVIVLDRISTPRAEMWGDISFTKTAPHTETYIEVRWYDPQTKTKHIVCNPEHVFCLTTKVPLAYNTIF